MTEPWQPGETIGRYRLEELLGSGMDQVWRATDQQTGKPVAIKVLEGDPDAAVLDLVEREARALARLTHPSIVRIYEVGRVGDHGYVVTEFVHGLDLATVISWGRVRIAWAVRIALQLAEATRAAHEVGVIHSDIKPGNVLIDPAVDDVKLADFGITRKPDRQGTLSMASTAAGRLAYIAPEQLTAQHVGRVSDIYSVGATLYHLFTGSPPRDATKLVSLVREAPTMRPASPRDMRPDLPESLSSAVMRMLEPRPADRPASLAGIIEVLASLTRSLPRPTGETLMERAIEAPATQRAPSATSLTIVFGDIVGTSLFVVQVGPFEVQRALAEFFRRLTQFHGVYSGRLVKTIGDGFMSVFQTVSNAFDFAVSLQRSLLDDPISVVPNGVQHEDPNYSPPLSLRLAIHVGPGLLIQTSYGDDVLGATVNLAARLTACAAPNEVVVSASARVALSSEQRSLLHPSERLALKGQRVPIEFGRLRITDLRR